MRAANDDSSSRDSSRRPTEIHGRMTCGETQLQVLGRIVNIPNYPASIYEKYYDTWRADNTKMNYRELPLGVGSYPFQYVHALMRRFKRLAIFMKPVTNTRVLSQCERFVS